MGKTKLKARLINEYLFDPITSIRIDGCNSRSVFLLFNHGPPIDIRSDKEDEIPDSNNKRQGKIYLSPIIRRDTIKYPENYGNKKSKIGKFLRNAATGAMAAYLLFAGPGCNLTSPYDADKPKPPEQYVLVINATGLYNNQPISNFHVRAEGPETEEVDGINGVARFEGDKALLKGPYRIILSNGPFYGGNAGDPAHPTRYVNLAGPTEFPVDLVENGSIDFTFLEDIMFNPTNRWTTTPRFDIYKKTLYEGKTYEFSDSDINNLRQWIQTYVPQMARGKQFQMGVPQVTVKEETFTNPAAPFVNNVIITYPFYYTSQARAPPDNNVLWAGKFPVYPPDMQRTGSGIFHELFHCFGFDDVHSQIYPTIMYGAQSPVWWTRQPSEHDLIAEYYLNSFDPGTGKYNVVPQPSWFAGALNAAMKYYNSVNTLNSEIDRSSDTIGNMTSFGRRSGDPFMLDKEMRARRDKFEEEMRRAQKANEINNLRRPLEEARIKQ
jgi:hypothetical protein